jgi:uncharacterized protein (UPF0335 family)
MTDIGHDSGAAAGFSEGQVKSFVERILRLREEQDSIGDDVKDVYAEAKSSGLDKTALGKVVATIRAERKNPAKFAEQQTLVDLYRAAAKL